MHAATSYPARRRSGGRAVHRRHHASFAMPPHRTQPRTFSLGLVKLQGKRLYPAFVADVGKMAM